MRRPLTKTVWALIIALVILSAVFLWLLIERYQSPTISPPTLSETASSTPVVEIIGRSVAGRAIETYTFGSGSTKLLFVGGVHGGYEWNSVLLAYKFIDYLKTNPAALAKNQTVTVIPNLNPDGVFAVTGKTGRFAPADVSTDESVLAAGRFNARQVDLNRNFDCLWQATSTWQNKTVSAGAKIFSEPETAALRDFVLADTPTAVIFWHSKSNAVYASKCGGEILPGTLTLMNTYAQAAGYPTVKTFDAYQTTGAADDWLAKIGIPAITVELSSHESLDWGKNLAGLKAVLARYGNQNS